MDQSPNATPQPELQQPPVSPQLTPAKRPWGKIIAIVIVAVIIVAGVIYFATWHSRQNSVVSKQGQPAISSTQDQNTWPQLAAQQQSALPSTTPVTATPQMKEANLPLAQIPNYQAVLTKYGLKLTATQQQFLTQNHFLLVPASSTKLSPSYNFDDMLAEFDSIGGIPMASQRTPDDTKLITPDVMLEAYHKFFDLTLKQLEKTDLTTSLGSFLTGLTNNLLAAEQQSTDYVQQRYQNVLAQMVVARVLFENKSPAKPAYFDSPDQENVYDTNDQTIDSVANAKTIATKYTAGLTPDLITKINQELDLIYAAKEVTASPLFGQYDKTVQSDYTQYTPRSHYTENSTLRAYFRTDDVFGPQQLFVQK